MGRSIFCHPEALEALKRARGIQSADCGAVDGPAVPIIASLNCPKHPVKFIYPKERFFEYGPEDLPWLRYFGLVREVEDTSRYVYFFMGIDSPKRFMQDPVKHPEFFWDWDIVTTDPRSLFIRESS